VPENERQTARRNLYVVTDYFLISFLFYVGSALSDYTLHQFTPHSWDWPALFWFLLLLTSGTTFVFGLLTLVVPMLYLRTIGRGGKDLGDINPPTFAHTLSVASVTALSTLMWVSQLAVGPYNHLASTGWGKALFVVTRVISYLGGTPSNKGPITRNNLGKTT